MTRRYTGAEARELAAKATGEAPEIVERDDGVYLFYAQCVGARAAVRATLFAAAPDLAESLAEVEAERDALRELIAAYKRAHDARAAHSKRDELAAEAWFNERDGLDGAVEAALAALREAAK